MMWFVWRQQRFEAVLGVAVLAAVATLLFVTGVSMINSYHHLGVGACLVSSSEACAVVRDAFDLRFSGIESITGWFNFLPLIFGIALAAPLVAEMESGTYRLAWTQSITRGRWLAARLTFVFGGAVILSLALMVLMHWWRGPLDHLQSSFLPNAFDLEGPTVIAYTVFATALVLAAGVLLRRTVPAIGIGLAGYLVARLGIENEVRAHYLAPLTRAPAPHVWERTLGWVLDSGWQNTSGQVIDLRAALVKCGFGGPGGLNKGSMDACMRQHGYVDYITYQPAGRYWIFQGIESAIFLGTSALLVLAVIGWMRFRSR